MNDPMETTQTHEDLHKALVDRLVANLRPVRRLWPVNARLAAWLFLEAAIVVLVVAYGSREDLSKKIHSLHYVLELAVLAAAGILAAVLALRAAIPGREPTSGELATTLVATAAAILLILAEPMSVDVSISQFIRAGLWCVFCTGALAALPWIALLWAVRRGAPLAVKTTGGFIGAAALLFSFAITRVGCPIDERLHLFTWHLMPAMIGIGLSVLAGTAWLRRTSAIRTPD